MKIVHLLIGTLIGFISCFLGVYLYITFFTDYHFVEGFTSLKSLGFAGKLLTLGAILNVVCFFVLLKFEKEYMARGVILATILLAFYTLFI